MSTYKNKKYLILVNYIKENQNNFYRLAKSYVKSKEEALDIVQESIYKALTSIEGLKNIEYMKTWMYRIIVNTSITYIRKNKRIVLTDEMPDFICTYTDTAEILDLYNAIDRLSESYKTVIILKYFEDLKIDEIALITNCNVNTVKSRLYSAIDKLKVIMKGDIYNEEKI